MLNVTKAMTLDNPIVWGKKGKDGDLWTDLDKDGAMTLCLQHVVPFLHVTPFLSATNTVAWLRTFHPNCLYTILHAEYYHLDSTPARGFASYCSFQTEPDLSTHHIRCSSAALLHCQMYVPCLVWYLGRPHLGIHCNVSTIFWRIWLGCDTSTVKEVPRIFTTGPPKFCKGFLSNTSFWHYYHTGNHTSAESDPSELFKVLVKDSCRGNTILKSRQIFYASFHITPDSSCINNWANKANEPPITFPGSFLRFLNYVWNLCISFPHNAILIMDNDVCNAYRLCKLNQKIVPMHAYQACRYLGLATGQSFSDCFCATNWDPPDTHGTTNVPTHSVHPRLVLTLCSSDPKIPPSDYPTVGHAPLDSINCTPSHPHPLAMPMHIDNLSTANVIATIRLASAASIMSLQDVFGPDHPCQEQILSQNKLNLAYTKERLLVGFAVNSGSMIVCLLPYCRTKILSYTHKEAWLLPRKTATIHDLATLLSLLGDAFQHYPWGLCHILVFRNTVCNSISATYHLAKRRVTTVPLPPHYGSLPADIQAHFTWLHIQDQEAFVCRHPPTPGPCQLPHIRRCVLYPNQPPRPTDFMFDHNTSDALHSGIGACILSLKIFCFLSYFLALYTRTKLLRAGPDYVHINTLEFLGILLCFIIGQLWHSQDPVANPPFPTLRTSCNNTAAIAWWINDQHLKLTLDLVE
eukprot:jgi/Psemu1/4475/gm1.4475_g